MAYADATSAKVLPTVVDWFECYSTDGGATYDGCIYTGTSEYGEDYWDPYNQWHTKNDCFMVQDAYCDQKLRAGPNGGAVSTAVSNNTQSDMSPSNGVPPSCSADDKRNNRDHAAWCDGVSPTGDRLTRIQAALDEMESFGNECAVMASLGRSILDSGNLHVFDGNVYRRFNGAAPYQGEMYGDMWIAISDKFTDIFYDRNHTTTGGPGGNDQMGGPRDLTQVLAHELDHVRGRDELAGNRTRTPNSQRCSGMPS